MARFKDRTGFEWDIVLTVGSVADVKRETGINLALASKDVAWVQAIYSDPEKFGQVLWTLLAPDAGATTPEEFARRFDGATLNRAGNALGEAVADFFPRSRVAKALRENLARLMDEADEKVVKGLESVKLTDSPSPTNSPGSAGSIPAG